jgi:hypothetical protein
MIGSFPTLSFSDTGPWQYQQGVKPRASVRRSPSPDSESIHDDEDAKHNHISFHPTKTAIARVHGLDVVSQEPTPMPSSHRVCVMKDTSCTV